MEMGFCVSPYAIQKGIASNLCSEAVLIVSKARKEIRFLDA